SSLQIAKFWGIASDRATMSAEMAGASASGTLQPVPERRVVGATPATAARTPATEPIAQRVEYSAGTQEGRSDAHGVPPDARDVITATLQKVGLLVPPGSKPAGDPRSIVSSTLRSVGLLRE